MGCLFSSPGKSELNKNLTEVPKSEPQQQQQQQHQHHEQQLQHKETEEPINHQPLLSAQKQVVEQTPKKEEPELVQPVPLQSPQQTPVAIEDSKTSAYGLLLCGAGESGKTTYTRQLRLKYLSGFDKSEKEEFISTIRGNLVETAQQLLIWLERRSLSVEEDSQDASTFISELDQLKCEFNEEVSENLKILWADPSMQEAFMHKDETPIPDHMDYFFDKIDELFDPDYVLTDEDVLRARIRTTGISNVTFDMNGALIRIYDVGGQKNERHKWEKVMSEVAGVIFCVSFSEFDKAMFEDENVLRMDDSLEIFDQITHRDKFSSSPIFLLCNKYDMFQTKIKETDSFGKMYPTFQGDIHDPQQCCQFLVDKFLARAGQSTTRPIVVYQLVALDPENVAEVTNKICKFISDNYLQ